MSLRSSVLRVGPLVLAALVGVIVLDGGFVYDDSSAIVENPIVNGQAPLWEAFVRDFWGRPARQGFTTWRPLMPMVWAQLWAWWPGNPLPFRIASVLLHVFAVAMAMRFVHHLEPSRSWAAAVGTLFALHPLNTEAVSAIVAQADLLSFALVLVACTIALRPASVRVGALCAFVFLIASLVKESALIFTPVAVLFFALRPGSARARWLAISPVAFAGIALIAFQVAMPRAPGISMVASNLAHQVQGGMRVLLGLHNIGRALSMTIWPSPLVPNHGYAAVELHSDRLALYAVLGVVLLLIGVAAGLWAIHRCRLDWVAALSFLYAPALLQSHWFARLITDLAERLLYPSILGLSMILTMALFRFVRMPAMRVGIWSSLSLIFLVCGYMPRRAWTETDALWIHAVRAEPRVSLHHHNVSNTYFRSDDVDRGAYHRLVYEYLVQRYPEPVQWDIIEASQSQPAPEAFIELPASLQPDDPCPFVRDFTSTAREYEPLYAYTRHHWAERYPSCGPWSAE